MAVCLAGACSAALASEYGNVIASTPVMAQVVVPQQACQNVTQVSPPETSGGGAVAGALIGGLADFYCCARLCFLNAGELPHQALPTRQCPGLD